MLSALGFIAVNLVSYFLALRIAPFWGLLAYMNVYFNAPNPQINWWASYLPFDRWSLLTSAVLLLSLIIHKSKLSEHKFENAKWPFVFLAISFIITHTVGLEGATALGKSPSHFVYLTFTYCLIVYIILRSITDADRLRLFVLGIILFVANLSLNAYLYGRRVNARLEGIGSADAFGSNEFGLLLASVIPLMFCFLKSGTKYEKIACIGALPFILNAFILCNSRGSAVAFAAGGVISFLLVSDKLLRRWAILAAIAALPLFLYLADEEYVERFSTLFTASSEMDEDEANQLSSGRTEIWAYGMEMAGDYPLGVGPEGFRRLSRFYMPDHVLTFRPGAEFGVRSAHNTFLQVMVEEGILGLIVWLMMCLSTFLALRKSFALVSDQFTNPIFWRLLIFGQSIGFVAINFGGLFNSRIYYEYFWWQVALAAVTLGVMRQLAKQAQKQPEENDSNSIPNNSLRR